MIRRLVLLLLILLPLAMTGCSDGNSSDGSEQPDNQAHPTDWIKIHPASALATTDFADCISCHGVDLKGNGEAVSCYSCHAFNVTPPFIIHPSTWSLAYTDHRAYAASNGTTTCAKCHGADLHGSVAAPSCFADSFENRYCHASGPRQVPHTLLKDSNQVGIYLNGAVHGPDAAADLTVCQDCHGEAGGPGDNPRFNVGIDSMGGTGCEACHGVNLAHPAQWAGENGLYHDHAGNIANACTLCHGVNLDGLPVDNLPVPVGVSCLGCHGVAPVGANASGCISCHGQPPNGQPPIGNVSPNRPGRHEHVRWTRPGETCNRCHNGAGVETAAHYDLTNPADVSFIHPDGDDTMSAVSTDTNTTCNGNCHIITDSENFIWSHTNETWY